jgi:hypothetical protein
MEAIIKFNLPEEQDEFDNFNNAGKYYSVIWDLDQYLRNFIKYPSDREDPILTDTMAKVRDELWRLMNEHNLSLDK